MTEIDTLLAQARALAYPATMTPALQMVEDRAFFPGGSGVLDSSMTVSNKPIMILGQDFDTETNYRKSLLNGTESNPTWTNLDSLLKVTGISEHQCFFTNVIMGVRVNLFPESQKKQKNTGASPAFGHPNFIKQCQAFFLKQLDMQRPKLVLVLGKMPAEFLAAMVEELRPWKQLKTITAIDAAACQFMRDVVFANGVMTTLVLLSHPSYRKVNTGKRRYKGLDVADAEIPMIQDALQVL